MSREILERGERYLQSLHEIAASIDQRASTLSSVFTAGAVTILAVLGTGFDTLATDLRLLIAGLTVAAAWFAAAWFCIEALVPTRFHVPGIHPSTWYSVSKQPINEVLGYAAEEYQERINQNLVINSRATKKLKRGTRLGAAAPAIGLLVWLATWAITSWVA